MPNKPKIMLHYIRMGTTGGPNVVFQRIRSAPLLCEKYDFITLNQTRAAGGIINIPLILELKKAIQKESPDIIHISGMQNAGFHCMVAAVLAGCQKRLISTFGFSGDAIGLSSLKRFAFNQVIEPLTLILATRVQGVSEFVTKKAMVQKYAKNKACYIFNFPPNVAEISEKKYVRQELGIGPEELVVATVSRIVYDKGYKQLAEAIRLLHGQNNIRFVVVGDGEYCDSFRYQVRDEIDSGKVLLLGKRDDVENILAESDVFVLPTLHETFGNVFLEASSVGIPSIATSVGGVPEIIVHNETGLLVPVYDVEALAAAITKVHDNPLLRKSMGQKAKERLDKEFSVDKLSRQFDELYQALLSE